MDFSFLSDFTPSQLLGLAAILLTMVTLLFVSVLVSTVRKTEAYKQYRAQWGKVVDVVTDFVFAAVIPDEQEERYELEAQRTGISKWTLYIQDMAGDLISKKIGRKLDIRELDALVRRIRMESDFFPDLPANSPMSGQYPYKK